MKRILVIEDDPAILRGLADALRGERYEVVTARDGEQGCAIARGDGIGLIVLDVMLPGKNGLDVCRDLRRAGVATPVLMLTCRKEEIDQVVGLELGADDYVAKPFSMKVLLARIRSLLRRSAIPPHEPAEYAFGDVKLDFRKQEAFRKRRPVKFSSREFEILKYLAAREGEVVTRDMLLTDVWKYGGAETIPTTRTVDNYIRSIRKQLEDDPRKPVHLLTVPKAGYKLVR